MKGSAEELQKKQSVKPFYVTTAQVSQFAIRPQKKIDTTSKVRNLAITHRDPDVDGANFGFLWKRESDKIGGGIGMSDSRLATCMDHYSGPREKALKWAIGNSSLQCKTDQPPGSSIHDKGQPVGNRSGVKPPEVQKDLQDILAKSYHHRAKDEHAMFTTTSNEIGKKGPTAATYTFDRVARQQKFSNSFPKTNESRDTGLNTSITKSSIHSSLDHF